MREFPAAASIDPPKRRVFTVSSLNRRIKDLLESELPQVWVEGEISNLSRPGSGHVYFSLKDEQCQIRCALFRGRSQYAATELVDGAQVLVRARLTMYEVRGDVQLVVQHVEDAGEGALRRAFELLKRKLQDEGLFDDAHKRPIPAFPRRVGIVTSPTGAAIRDIVATFKRRFPAIPLLVYPVTVQGDSAPGDICGALSTASRHGACDVLILARGGGSLEDLKAFNDERVARAVFDCDIPIVCGVGHESDVTVCDFVADHRAPTPTAAAELVSPNAAEWLEGVVQTELRLTRLITGRVEQLSQRVDWLNRLIVHPRQQLQARAQRLSSVSNTLIAQIRSELQGRRIFLAALPSRLAQHSPVPYLLTSGSRIALIDEQLRQRMRTMISTHQQRLKHAISGLNSVNPLEVLARGYAVVTDTQSQEIIKALRQTRVDAEVDVQISDGKLRCTVKEKHPND